MWNKYFCVATCSISSYIWSSAKILFWPIGWSSHAIPRCFIIEYFIRRNIYRNLTPHTGQLFILYGTCSLDTINSPQLSSFTKLRTLGIKHLKLKCLKCVSSPERVERTAWKMKIKSLKELWGQIDRRTDRKTMCDSVLERIVKFDWIPNIFGFWKFIE